MALHNKNVRTTNRFRVTDVHLTISKVISSRFQNIDSKIFCNILRKFGVCPASDQNEVFVRLAFKNYAHHVSIIRSVWNNSILTGR